MERRRRTTVLGALLVLGALGLGLLAFGATAEAQASRRGGTLRIANIGEPPTLDPSATTVGITGNVGTQIFETPFAFDASWRPQPMLVDSHAVSADGRTHTFKLRRGVLFHNGKEMTAEDVVASLVRWGKVGSRGAVVFRHVETVTAPDKYTVVMSLKEPFAPLLAFLALPSSMAAIMPKEIAEATPAGPVTEFIGTGPYRFVEWIPNRHVRLARWDKYAPRSEPASLYAGRREPLVDEVIYYPVGNVATRIAGVQSGDYDLADDIAQDLYAQLKGDARVVPEIHQPGTWLVFFFNKKAGLMANVKLRQAVIVALSMPPILQVTFGNPDLFQLTPSIYPKGTPWYSETGAAWYNQGNAERAKQLAAEAGYKGEPIRWLTTQQYPWMHKSSTVAADQLRKAGFNVDQQVYEWAGVVGSGPAHYALEGSIAITGEAGGVGDVHDRARLRPRPGPHRRVQPDLSRLVGVAREDPALPGVQPGPRPAGPAADVAEAPGARVHGRGLGQGRRLLLRPAPVEGGRGVHAGRDRNDLLEPLPGQVGRSPRPAIGSPGRVARGPGPRGPRPRGIAPGAVGGPAG